MLKPKKILGISFGSKVINVKKKLFSELGKKKSIEVLKKTGPKKLFWTKKNENSLSLAVNSLKNLSLPKKILSEIEILFFVTESPIYSFPGNGIMLASKFKLNDKIKIYDLNLGCTGFVETLIIADKFKKKTLIICSETYSKHYKKFDRSMFPIFSDAATSFYNYKRIKLIKSLSGFGKNTYDDLFSKNNHVKMNGSKIYNFITSSVLPSLDKFLIKYKKFKIKKLYIHQASKLVLELFQNKYGSFEFDIPTNIEKYGNTNASTIPILLGKDIESKRIKKGDFAILCSFGVGLSYNIALVKIDE